MTSDFLLLDPASLLSEMETRRRQNLSDPNLKFTELEKEWARYKYLILQYDPLTYQAIRRRLNDKTDAPVSEFYQMVDQALTNEENKGYAINAFLHVSGYFKNHWDTKQKAMFQVMMEEYREGKLSDRDVKAYLKKEALLFQEEYLINSYFFITRP